MKAIFLVLFGLSGWSFGQPLTRPEAVKMLREAVEKTGVVAAPSADFNKREAFSIKTTCDRYPQIQWDHSDFRAKLLEAIAKAQAANDPVLKQPDRVRLLADRTEEAKKLAEKDLSQSIFGSDNDNKLASEKERLRERQEKKDLEWQKLESERLAEQERRRR